MKIDSERNIDKNVQDISNAIIKAAEISIPNKIITVRPTDPPWITCYIKRLIRKRKLAFRQHKKTNNIHYWNKYKTLRNKVITELRKSKQSFHDSLDQLLSSGECNSKTFWKTSKQILKLGRVSASIPTLHHNGIYAESDHKKLLNIYFTSQAVVDDTNTQLPSIPDIDHSLEFITITIQDVSDVFQNLDVTKACGPDLISRRLLKEGCHILTHPYSIIFNRSHSSWKDANVTPIYKKEDKSLPSNYRPISLLSIAGKMMECCVHKHLYNYMVTNQLLTPLHSGFREGDSTTNQLLHTYHKICEAVDKGKEIRAVFCDIIKAFDRVWHKGLLYKLRCMRCKNCVVMWFESYLSQRRQRVLINGQSSDWVHILAGVPQGSILGPLLFLININDIVKHIGCSIRLFADDTNSTTSKHRFANYLRLGCCLACHI